MIRTRSGLAALALWALGSAAAAQSATAPNGPEVASAPGAVLQGLDRLAGELTELDVPTGGTAELGDLFVTLEDCRYPVDNPSGDAYAYLVIRDRRIEAPVFQGWMVASAPALNALDHMRYDVWVMRCNTSTAGSTGAATSN